MGHIYNHVAVKNGLRSIRFIGILAAIAALAALFITVPPANAQDDAGSPPPVTIDTDTCTVNIPEVQGVNYKQDRGQDPRVEGTYDAGHFFPNRTFTAYIAGEDGEVEVGSSTIEVPIECAVQVTATCDTVTFKKLAADWSTLQAAYGADENTEEEVSFDTAPDEVTVDAPADPVHYKIFDVEMGLEAQGMIELQCEAPKKGADTTTESPSKASVPKVAPSSGL